MSRKEERPSRNFMLYRALAIRVHRNIIHNTVFCEQSFGNNVDRFRSGSGQISEVHACSNEIAMSRTSSKYDRKIRVQLDYM